MDKKYFETLKKIDCSEVVFRIGSNIKAENSNDIHIKAIITAYALKVLQENNLNLEISNVTKAVEKNSEVQEIISRYISYCWNCICDNYQRFSISELEAFILFDNSLEDYKCADNSTPTGIINLASRLLNINKGDNVLELCSGKGNFFVQTFEDCIDYNYTGVELNYVMRDISVIRQSLISNSCSIELCDALEYESSIKFDKLFSNYPFMVKTPSINDYKERLQKTLNLSKESLLRASSDWVFNATLIEKMNDNGKAVAIMTNGSTWNNTDKLIRKYFIENGYVEAVIALPANLFNSFSIATTMIVFSKSNKSVRLVDARDICKNERRKNIITEENVDAIIELLSGDSEISISKDINDFAENEYVLNATRYLEVTAQIPNGVEFGSVIKNITRGSQIKATELDEMKSSEPTEYRYLMLANIENGVISFSEDEQYLKELPAKMEKYCIKNNSIVLSKIGTPTFKSAVAIVNDNEKLLANGNLFVIELDEEKVNPFYVQAFFASEVGVAGFRSIYTGAAIQTISLDKLKKMIIPLPSLDEQIKIGAKYAAAMDEIILLRRKLEKTLNRMNHIFDGEE